VSAQKFASGKYTIADCDRCGFRYKRKDLKELVIRTHPTDLQVCNDPETDIKKTGIKIRGTGAATKGTMARGPMA
jgi:hypothetical protein